MQRIAFNIDPIAYVRNTLLSTEPDPLTAVVLAEIGGAESIVCYLRDDQRTVLGRDVQLLKSIVKTHLNVRSNLTEANIRKLIALKVDMITFVAPGNVETITPQSLPVDTYSAQLADYVNELRSNNILSSVLIEPRISEIKLAGKLELDYVELNTKDLSAATDMESEMDFLDNLSGLALAGSKLGMGINISGGIGYDNLREIASLDFVEDIIIGEPILNKAIYIGIEAAIRDLNTLI